MFLSTYNKLDAQETGNNAFEAYGEPILTVFSNFHTSISQNVDQSAIEIRRAYLGYEYQIHPHFSIVAKLDIGSPDDRSAYSLINRYAYFKNAALKYRKDDLSVDFGLIGLKQFKLQEKFWGYRYIYKSFLDEHDFGPSADIGASIAYKFNEVVEADFTIMNGEGYVQLQADNTYKAGAGITLTPMEGLVARVYFDETRKHVRQTTLATFLGYRFRDLFRLGAEFNLKRNEGYIENHNMTGYSLYGTLHLHERFEIFGRYDRLESNVAPDENRPWNLINNGTAVIAGIQYLLIRQVRISLNYQDWYPLAVNAQNEAYIYLNFEYKID